MCRLLLFVACRLLSLLLFVFVVCSLCVVCCLRFAFVVFWALCVVCCRCVDVLCVVC